MSKSEIGKERERERERQTDSRFILSLHFQSPHLIQYYLADRQRPIDRQTNKWADRQTDKLYFLFPQNSLFGEMRPHLIQYYLADRQSQIDRQTNRWSDRQTDRQLLYLFFPITELYVRGNASSLDPILPGRRHDGGSRDPRAKRRARPISGPHRAPQSPQRP